MPEENIETTTQQLSQQQGEEQTMGDSLILFSGGKDSFITTCRQVREGNKAKLISFNNGCVAGEENLLHGVTRLQNRYGKEKIEYVGIYNTSALIARLNMSWTYMTQKELGEKYPHLINAQLNCLHCQTAMWISAIAWAKAKQIHKICAGNRQSDPFCTGMNFFRTFMAKMASDHNIQVEFPVWNDAKWVESHGWERDQEMVRQSFEPQVLEPKCLLGRPVDNPDNDMLSDMEAYFTNELTPQIKAQIDKQVNIFRHMRLHEHSLEVLHYTPNDGSEGIY